MYGAVSCFCHDKNVNLKHATIKLLDLEYFLSIPVPGINRCRMLLFTAISVATSKACETCVFSPAEMQGQSLGMLAMCCINELLNKNCVPADFESYLLQLFQQTFYLLKKLTHSGDNKLASLDDS